MRWLKHAWILGAALVALGTYLAFAQPITQTTLTGNESWNAGQGPGGPTVGFIYADQLRGSMRDTVLSAVSGNLTIGVACGNCTQVGTPTLATISGQTGGNVLVTAQPSAAVWTLPSSPIGDGIIIGICNTTASAWVTNAQTVAASSGSTSPTNNTITTTAAGACARYQYNLSQTTWYRVQ